MSAYFACSFCGEDRGVDERRFTITEAGWDRVKIMRWSPETPEASVLKACCSDHAKQLAGQWLITGNLASPFARAVLGESPMEATDSAWPGCEIVCELAVDRESVDLLLEENPEFLDTMLEALGEALGGHSSSDGDSCDEPEEMVAAMAAD